MSGAQAWGNLTDLAEAQWGMVTAAQARQLRVAAMELTRYTARGFLEREAHGVYRVRGAPRTLNTDLQAAWLQLAPTQLVEHRQHDGSSGDTAVVSHSSAARVQGLGNVPGERHEFTTSAARRTRRRDVDLHRGGPLQPGHVHLVDGLPVTTPWRTVRDLAATLHDSHHIAGVLGDAIRYRALAPRDVDVADLDPLARRHGLRPGAGAALLTRLLELSGLAPAPREAFLAATAPARSGPTGRWTTPGMTKGPEATASRP